MCRYQDDGIPCENAFQEVIKNVLEKAQNDDLSLRSGSFSDYIKGGIFNQNKLGYKQVSKERKGNEILKARLDYETNHTSAFDIVEDTPPEILRKITTFIK